MRHLRKPSGDSPHSSRGHEIPETIVSDNGPQFVAREFENLCEANVIQHVQVAPYHLTSNELAERVESIFKEGLKKQTV